MEKRLQKMDTDKKTRIINSAIDEFSQYPYNKASTNNIVKSAGISKGLLFHYFGNKKDLYEYIRGFVIKKIVSEVSDRIDWDNPDLLERLKQIVMVKLDLSIVYPKLFDFAMQMFRNEHITSLDKAQEIYQSHGFNLNKLFEDVYSRNIDFSIFRNPQLIPEYINIIRWTLEKFGEELLLSLQPGEGIDQIKDKSNEMNTYIDILKESLYRQS